MLATTGEDAFLCQGRGQVLLMGEEARGVTLELGRVS